MIKKHTSCLRNPDNKTKIVIVKKILSLGVLIFPCLNYNLGGASSVECIQGVQIKYEAFRK